jgi:hypothetical protein
LSWVISPSAFPRSWPDSSPPLCAQLGAEDKRVRAHFVLIAKGAELQAHALPQPLIDNYRLETRVNIEDYSDD